MSQKPAAKLWQKSPYANLTRYIPSGTYFARVRINGKLKPQSLKTKTLSVARMRLHDFIKAERQQADRQDQIADGKLTFGDALKIYQARRASDPNLKPRTKAYYEERIIALRKSWPDLEGTDIRKISKAACLEWAIRCAKFSPSAFNHTLSALRNVIEIGVEQGARWDNPAKAVKRMRERNKPLQLPDQQQFTAFLVEIERSGSGWSKPCADLVRFLAFGGFRLAEAKEIRWRDVDLLNRRIFVRGDEVTGTKNWEQRNVPISPEMGNFLKRLREENGPTNPDERVMKVGECQKAMTRAAKKVGMARITHHDLRHLFVTRSIELGVDIPTIARWAGHKDGGALIMKTYGHLRDEHSTNMADRLWFETRPDALTVLPLPKAAA